MNKLTKLPMNQAQIENIKAGLRPLTDVDGNLSYSNGVKNILDIKSTNEKIRLKVENPSNADKLLVICPWAMDGEDTKEFLSDVWGVNGYPFFCGEVKDGSDTIFKVTALDEEQNLSVLGMLMRNQPTFFRYASMKSYTTAGAPEATNFGNAITHYRMDFYKGLVTKDTPLVLTDFEKRSDNTTSIMKIDFIDKKFKAFASDSDLIVFRINKQTTVDLELIIGARHDRTENFYKQVTNGIDLLHAQFPEVINGDCNC